jgi:hypothetical protein
VGIFKVGSEPKNRSNNDHHDYQLGYLSRFRNTEVGGHLAANFSFHNPLSNLILQRTTQVGGQLAGIHAKVGGHLAVNFVIRNSFTWFMLKRSSKVGGQLACMPQMVQSRE